MSRSKRYKIQDYYPFESKSRVRPCADGKERHRFEHNGKEQTDTTTLLTYSMMISEAFKDLTARQRMLYVYAKGQFYGARSRPCSDFPEIPEFKEYKGQKYFYLNHRLLSDVYGLYPKSNHRDLYNDTAALIAHGFIEWYTEPKAVNKSNHMRTIYRYSEAWKDWKPGYEYRNEGNGWKWVKQNSCDNM